LTDCQICGKFVDEQPCDCGCYDENQDGYVVRGNGLVHGSCAIQEIREKERLAEAEKSCLFSTADVEMIRTLQERRKNCYLTQIT
jgi:hypothetical protein